MAILVSVVKRAPGSVKLRTGGDSPRPGRGHRPVEPVEFRYRRSKSGWEAARARPAVIRRVVLAFGGALGRASASHRAPRSLQALNQTGTGFEERRRCSPESWKNSARSPAWIGSVIRPD